MKTPKYEIYDSLGHIIATIAAPSMRVAARDYFRRNPGVKRLGIGRVGEDLSAYYDRTDYEDAARMTCTPVTA